MHIYKALPGVCAHCFIVHQLLQFGGLVGLWFSKGLAKMQCMYHDEAVKRECEHFLQRESSTRRRDWHWLLGGHAVIRFICVCALDWESHAWDYSLRYVKSESVASQDRADKSHWCPGQKHHHHHLSLCTFTASCICHFDRFILDATWSFFAWKTRRRGEPRKIRTSSAMKESCKVF